MAHGIPEGLLRPSLTLLQGLTVSSGGGTVGSRLGSCNGSGNGSPPVPWAWSPGSHHPWGEEAAEGWRDELASPQRLLIPWV